MPNGGWGWGWTGERMGLCVACWLCERDAGMARRGLAKNRLGVSRCCRRPDLKRPCYHCMSCLGVIRRPSDGHETVCTAFYVLASVKESEENGGRCQLNFNLNSH